MPPKPKQEIKLDRLAELRAEIIDVLEEYLHELNVKAEKNPGEHNVEPLRCAKQALRLFKPDNPTPYS